MLEKITITSLLPQADKRYTSPTVHDIRALLAFLDLSGEEAAKLLGVSSGRTVRRWTTWSSDRRKIPYANWRFLVLHAGLGDPAYDVKLVRGR